MSVQTEIDRIITAVQAAHEKVVEKGGTTTQPYLVGNLASAIDSIPNATEPVLQAKTVTPTTAKQTVTADSGYDGLSKVEVNAMPTATQATPSITVSSSGLITATSTQSAGYVVSGTKSATKQLTVQAAKTVTPTTSNQTAVASGRYTTGAITVKGDSNLVAGNIKSGVSIFGVAGTYEGSGGGSGGGSVETCTVTITSSVAGYLTDVVITQYIDGVISVYNSKPANVKTITVENVVCGSAIGFYTSYVMIAGCSVTDGAKLIEASVGYGTYWRFSAPTNANITATISVWDDD